MRTKSVIIKRISAIFIIFAVAFTMMPAAAGKIGTNAASPYWKNFKVKATGKTTVKLSWKKLSKKQQKKIAGIAVYRNGKLIKRIKKTRITYTDKKLKAGKTYKYQLRTYKKTTKKIKKYWNKKAGKWQKKKIKGAKTKIVKRSVYNYNDKSAIKNVTTKKRAVRDSSGSSSNIIEPPGNVKAVYYGPDTGLDGTYSRGEINLSWDAVEDADFYRIYSNFEKEPYETKWTDQLYSLDLGKTYKFSITAVDKSLDKESEKSATVEIKLPETGEEAVVYENWVEQTASGYMRVFYDGKKVWAEFYDNSFKMTSRKAIDMELPIWGGYYKGKDAYYLVEGQSNKDCIDGTEVIRIIKYDFNWNRLGSGSVFAQEGWNYEIRYPFYSPHVTVSMAESGGSFYVATGREGYVDEQIGQGHQGMMLICMDEDSLETKVVYGDFYHSFSQHILCQDSNIYLLEESEGNRCTRLSRFNGNSFDVGFPVLKYGGERTSVWSVQTYATAEGIALSSENILGLGTSIDQTNYSNGANEPYNLYLTVAPKTAFSTDMTSFKWLTDYSDTAGSIYHSVNITKINDDRFLISWSLTNVKDNHESKYDEDFHYLFVNGSGEKISKELEAKVIYSDCKPALCGDKVVFCAFRKGKVYFYSINAKTGELSTTSYQKW